MYEFAITVTRLIRKFELAPVTVSIPMVLYGGTVVDILEKAKDALYASEIMGVDINMIKEIQDGHSASTTESESA